MPDNIRILLYSFLGFLFCFVWCVLSLVQIFVLRFALLVFSLKIFISWNQEATGIYSLNQSPRPCRDEENLEIHPNENEQAQENKRFTIREKSPY